MDAFSARASIDSCVNVRATIPCTQRSRFFATSGMDSRWPSFDSVWSRNTEAPPRLEIPTSKVTRVRSDGFSKISARKRPANDQGGPSHPQRDGGARVPARNSIPFRSEDLSLALKERQQRS